MIIGQILSPRRLPKQVCERACERQGPLVPCRASGASSHLVSVQNQSWRRATKRPGPHFLLCSLLRRLTKRLNAWPDHRSLGGPRLARAVVLYSLARSLFPSQVSGRYHDDDCEEHDLPACELVRVPTGSFGPGTVCGTLRMHVITYLGAQSNLVVTLTSECICRKTFTGDH